MVFCLSSPLTAPEVLPVSVPVPTQVSWQDGSGADSCRCERSPRPPPPLSSAGGSTVRARTPTPAAGGDTHNIITWESQRAAEGRTSVPAGFTIWFQWNRPNRWEVGGEHSRLYRQRFKFTHWEDFVCLCELTTLLCTSLSDKSIFIILLILPDMWVVLKHNSGFVVVVLCV